MFCITEKVIPVITGAGEIRLTVGEPTLFYVNFSNSDNVDLTLDVMPDGLEVIPEARGITLNWTAPALGVTPDSLRDTGLMYV